MAISDNGKLLYQMEQIRPFFRQYGIELIILSSALLLSIICIALSVWLRLHYHRQISLEYLGWGMLATTLWNVAASPFSRIFYQNEAAPDNLARYIFMLIPLPFLFYMDAVQDKRYHKLYRLMEILVLADFVLCALLKLTGLFGFSETSPCTAVTIILFALLIIITEINDVRTGHIREYCIIAAGCTIILIVSLLKIVFSLTGIDLLKHALLPTGLILLFFFAMANTAQEIMKIERMRQEAQLASAAKGKFLANMSHEIRTPINAVLGMNAMILRESTESAIREYALDIQNAGQSLLSLINDILDLSKAESGKLDILPQEYDLGTLIHDVMNMISTKAADKGLDIHLLIDDTIPARLWGDDVRIRQILVNLMNNAVKYTEQGCVTLSVSGTVNGDTVILDFKVQDTGIGIKQEDLSKLFAEFERIEEDRNRNIEGTGLGMSITTQLLERMDSHLQVESVYGKGSVFSFSLLQKIIDNEPVGNLEERISRQAEEYSYQVSFTAPEALILVVDDNALNRRVFKNLLKATEVMVEEAGGGMECLKMTRQKHYDIIFLDHMMPDLDGIETLHRLLTEEENPCRNVPVVALTANALAGAKERYLAEGFYDFLSKPILPDKLEKMLRETLPPQKVSHKSAPDAKKTVDAPAPQEMPNIDGVDWDYALRFTNDPNMLTATVLDFYQTMDTEAGQLAQLAENIETAAGMQDLFSKALGQYEVQVHSMKSAAGMVGAVPLSGVARLLEYAARDGKADTVARITPAFLEEWMALRERLHLWIGKHETEKTEAEPAQILELLSALEGAMTDMNIDMSDEIAAQLHTFRYSELITPLMEKLFLAVTNLDNEQAKHYISEIKNKIAQG